MYSIDSTHGHKFRVYRCGLGYTWVSRRSCCAFREALFPGLDLDSGLDWTLDWTHGLWLNSALEHSLKPDQLVDALAIALALCKSWIFSNLISMVSL